MAKINKYWGFVAIGALTAAAAGAVAAVIAKETPVTRNLNSRMTLMKISIFQQNQKKKKKKRKFPRISQAWETVSAQEETQEEESPAKETDTAADEAGRLLMKELLLKKLILMTFQKKNLKQKKQSRKNLLQKRNNISQKMRRTINIRRIFYVRIALHRRGIMSLEASPQTQHPVCWLLSYLCFRKFE